MCHVVPDLAHSVMALVPGDDLVDNTIPKDVDLIDNDVAKIGV